MEAGDRLFGPPPTVFCGPACLDAAVNASWDERELVDKRLAELAVWAAEINRARKKKSRQRAAAVQGGVLPTFDQLDIFDALDDLLETA